jgi:hypothetical protein
MVTYDELVDRLAVDLAYLDVRDFVSLLGNDRAVQVIQEPDGQHAELLAGPLEPAEQEALRRAGWQLGGTPKRPIWTVDVPWPLTAEAARRLAERIVDAARTLLAPDIDNLEYDARNYNTWDPVDLPSLRDLRRAPSPR